jgi:polyferredoxin
MRLVRSIYQLFFFALFVFLLVMTAYDRIGGYPVRLFLDTDPLAAISTALSTGTLYRALWWAIPIIILTIFLGRFYCGWICPLGALQDWSALLRKSNAKRDMEINRHRPVYRLKYLILIAFLVMAVFGILQIGLIDPIVLTTRAFATSMFPSIDRGSGLLFVSAREFQLGWIALALLLAILIAAYIRPRLWCKLVCPLGALLGLLSRWSIFHIIRKEPTCTDCELCIAQCQAGADPDTRLRKSECMLLFNCLETCPPDALTFGPVSKGIDESKPIVAPDLSRRRLVGAILSGLAVPLFLRARSSSVETPREQLIRPPGARPEPDFLERCIKCEECMHICPTNVLQPSMTEAGFEGFWTPVLKNTVGYCELNCVLCGEVCPTGAIDAITLDRKLGRGEHEGNPVVLGTAFFDRGRCLPWAMNRPCVVCQEVCPTSPKAIVTDDVFIKENGRTIHLKRPRIEPDLCIGCGICEHECPVTDRRAVYVTSVGESRSKHNRMILDTYADTNRRAP